MASISQGIVLTTAMLLSTTLLYVAFSRQKTTQIHHSNKPTLRSCLYSEEKKRGRKKKKKVKFAENVKEGREQKRVSRNCREESSESGGMPANRMALYNGILRDRVHRTECSY